MSMIEGIERLPITSFILAFSCFASILYSASIFFFLSVLETKLPLSIMVQKSILFALLASTAFGALNKRYTFPLPASEGSETFDEPYEIAEGETFDGGMKTYGRGVECTGQDEGGEDDTVFIVREGGTLKNAIIGVDQIEGVYCLGSCTIENVWWEKVCEGMAMLCLLSGHG